MTSTSLETSNETHVPLSSVENLQFEWLARAGRLSNMATLVISSDMNIRFYDSKVAEILELDTTKDFTQSNALELVGQLAKRGDFGPGDPQIFIDLVKLEFAKPAQDDEQTSRSLNFLTPSGRRIQFRIESVVDGDFILACRDITKSYVEKHALKVAMDNSNSGYMIFDMETRRFKTHGGVSSNSFSQNLTRRLVNSEHRDNIHPDDFKKLKQIWIKAHEKRESWTGSFRTKDTKGETIWVKTHATPQISESGRITSYIFYYTEVTAQVDYHMKSERQ